MRLYLARHATHDLVGNILSGRCAASALNAQGRREAALLAEALAGARIGAVHCSPQQRTRETARIIADRLKLEVEIVDALNEIDFGDWTGRSFAELAEDPLWARWNDQRSRCAPPDGETMQAAVDRARRHVETAVADGDALLCVSHCDVIRGLIAHYLGLDLDHMLRFDVDPASLSIVDLGDWGARVVAINRVPA